MNNKLLENWMRLGWGINLTIIAGCFPVSVLNNAAASGLKENSNDLVMQVLFKKKLF